MFKNKKYYSHPPSPANKLERRECNDYGEILTSKDTIYM